MGRWVPVVGYEGIYEVSNTGQVRSVRRLGNYQGRKVRAVGGNVLKPGISKHGGYPVVALCWDGDTKTVYVHTLVLEAFIGPKPRRHEACHRDGDSTNNRVSNLYWGTRTDNVQDMYRHGTWSKERPTNRGELHTMAKLSEEQALEIRRRRAQGESPTLLAEQYGVSYYTIWSIATRRTWKHV